MRLNQSGISLVEVVIIAGIGAVISLAILTITQQLQKEMRSLLQGSEIVEFKTVLLETLKNNAVCTWQLQGKTIDVTTTTGSVQSPSSISLNELYQGPDNTSAKIAEVGQVLPLSTYGISVREIRFGNIFATGNPSEFKGQFLVTFDETTLTRPVRPATAQITFTANTTNPAAAIISACGTAPPTGPTAFATGDFACPCTAIGSRCNTVITHNRNQYVLAGAATMRALPAGANAHGASIVAQDLNTFTVQCMGQAFGYYNRVRWWYYYW